MVNDAAAVPPKLTDETHDKLVPVITTVPPVESVVGENDVIVGEPPVLVKLAVLLPVPFVLVTDIMPDPPQGTTAVMVVALTTANDVAAVPPKVTPDAQLKFVPVMVIVAPGAAEVGRNDATLGVALE